MKLGAKLKAFRPYLLMGTWQGMIISAVWFRLKPTRREGKFALLYFAGLFSGAWAIWYDARHSGELNNIADSAVGRWDGLGSRTPPPQRKQMIEKLEKIEDYCQAIGRTDYQEIQKQFGVEYSRGWIRQARKIRDKFGAAP